MKGIILAGGTGSRLYPITKMINKHLLPVYDRPMVYYPLAALINSGLKEIIVVSTKEAIEQFRKLFSSNGTFSGINFNFVIQEQAGGSAQALSKCRHLVAGENIAVILGDNIFSDNFNVSREAFETGSDKAKIFLKEVGNPERHSIAVINNGKILDIEEKPASPKSNLAVTGLAMFNREVWGIIDGLRPTIKGELEITDIYNYFIKQGSLGYEIIQGEWFDLDTFNSMLLAANWAAK